MRAPRFEKAKVTRLINTIGEDIEFKRSVLNEYNEATDEAVSIAKVKGVYRNTSAGYISVTSTEAASVRSSKVPMVLVLWDDSIKTIKQNDFVTIGERKLYVTGVENVGEWNLLAEVSLSEVITDGV